MMQKGKASIIFEKGPYLLDGASIAGKKEGEGPLGKLFDRVEPDGMLGMKTWEEAESKLQTSAVETVLEKTRLKTDDIRYLFAGDLLGQLIATSFGLLKFEIPLFGLFGACSTMGEAISLAAMTVHAGYADRTLALASSHFATAEKQFRFPLDYGNQRPPSATWTTTGCGAVVIVKTAGKNQPKARIGGITTGRIVDMGFKDSMNMGAAMAPAAFHTILQHFRDFGRDASHYDRIITGDLGTVGQKILLDLLNKAGFPIAEKHMDCGIEIYDSKAQDTHAGGSGCACSALTLSAYILPKIKSGEWQRVLFVPTGALLSPMSFNEGQSIPGIAHGVILEHV